MLDQQTLAEHLSYDRETGEFTRLRTSGGVWAGLVRVKPDADGYTVIRVAGKKYKAHRLAWLASHGEWPAGEIDHINGVKTDNRLVNLRVVTKHENAQNKHRAQSNSKSGVKGVTFHKATGKWAANIVSLQKHHHLGLFDRVEDAAAAYAKAAAIHHRYNPMAAEAA